jgi:outer membrane protein assembly factor BamB
LLASVGLGACSASKEVSVGSASARVLDLSTCRGTDCSPEVASQLLETTNDTTCDPGTPVALGRSWEERLDQPHDCDGIGACLLEVFKLTVAPDGSLWVTARASSVAERIEAGAWLAHYTADGELLSETMVDSYVPGGDRQFSWSMNAVADSRGHAFVAVQRFDFDSNDSDGPSQRSAWLAQYDQQGQQVGDNIALSGGLLYPMLARTGSDSLAIGARELEGGGGGIGLIGSDGTPRWTQTGVAGAQLHSLLGDMQGRITVYTSGMDRLQLSFDVQQFGGDGQLLWHRTRPRSASFGFPAELGFGALSAGLDGALLWGGHAIAAGESAYSEQLVVQKIAADGRTLWTTRIQLAALTYLSELSSTAPVTAADGIVYLGGGLSFETSVLTLHSISPDGSTCRTLVSANAAGDSSGLYALATGPTGELFFVGQYGFGRFEDPNAAPSAP